MGMTGRGEGTYLKLANNFVSTSIRYGLVATCLSHTQYDFVSVVTVLLLPTSPPSCSSCRSESGTGRARALSSGYRVELDSMHLAVLTNLKLEKLKRHKAVVSRASFFN